MENFNWKWLIGLVVQLGTAMGLIFGSDDAAMKNIGVGLLGSSIGQGVTAQSTLRNVLR